MQQEIYFDNSATTRQYDEVTTHMAEVAAKAYGNPSSLHKKGIEAERLVTSAREAIAATLKVEPAEIIFTSGGTESNNLAIKGYLDANTRNGKRIITTKIEHPSVLEVFKHMESREYEPQYIGVDEAGRVSLDDLRQKMNKDTALISVMLVNNETGVIQQIGEISEMRNHICPQAAIFVDAVQAYGKMEIFPSKLGIDMMSVSSHKLHGPKGVGALYVSGKKKIKPLLHGGGQETALRSGTENVPGISGFALAVEITFSRLDNSWKYVSGLNRYFLDKLSETGLDCKVNSPSGASPYIINVAFANVRAEVLLHHLEQRGIYVSTGSACSSHKNTRSHVLTAMGVTPGLIDGSVRFSFSSFNTIAEIDAAMEALKEIIPQIEINRKQKLRRHQ